MSNYQIDTSAITDGPVPVYRSEEISQQQGTALSEAGWIKGAESPSGIRVNRRTALSYDAVWRAVNLISQTVAKLPLVIYRRRNGGKERATNHPAYRLLKYEPNEEMTAFTFRETMMGHVLLSGNAYAYIDRDGDATPTALWMLDPEATYPVRENGVLWYVAIVRNELLKIHPDNMLHIRGLGYDGMLGYSVLQLAKESLGLGLAARRFGAVYFKNGAKSSGVLMYPSKLKQDAIETLRSSWEKVHAGVSNQHKIAILEDGVKYQQLTIPPNESQFLETRQFSRVEVANWFQVPPHKIGDSSKSSYNSLEQENQAWLDEGLDGWLCRWEGESRKKLCTERQKSSDTHVVEFLRAALLRSNLAVRGAYYRTAVSTGWMSRDEVRAAENLNPIPDGEGAKFLVPLNMGVAGEPDSNGNGNGNGGDSKPADDDDAKRELLVETITRMARRLWTYAGRQQSAPEDVRDADRDVIRRALGPVVRLTLRADADPTAIADRLCRRFLGEYQQIQDVDAWGEAFAEQLLSEE